MSRRGRCGDVQFDVRGDNGARRDEARQGRRVCSGSVGTEKRNGGSWMRSGRQSSCGRITCLSAGRVGQLHPQKVRSKTLTRVAEWDGARGEPRCGTACVRAFRWALTVSVSSVYIGYSSGADRAVEFSAEHRRCDTDEQDHDHYLHSHSRRARHNCHLYVISPVLLEELSGEEERSEPKSDRTRPPCFINTLAASPSHIQLSTTPSSTA